MANYTLEQIRNSAYDANEINKRLCALYNSMWGDYTGKIRGNENATNPYLICASEKYAAAKIRVMFIGQDTFTWGGEFNTLNSEPTTDDLMNLYNLFANKDLGYNSPFWNFYWSVMKRNHSNPDYGYIFNNVIKIGRPDKTGFNKEVETLTSAYFNVLKKEIDILSPDILFFGTGPKYDPVISAFLGEFSKEPITEFPEFVKMTFVDSTLPVAYRTYHPRYMSLNHLYRPMSDYLYDIIAKFEK